jgi:hypothetical protein
MSKNSEDQGGGSPWIRAAQIYIKESPDYDKSVLAASEFKRRGIYAVWNPGLRIEYPLNLTSRIRWARLPRYRWDQKDFDMKPEHEERRKIIREWMSLPKDKRQTEEQAKPFATKAMERIPSSANPYRQIMRWLLPRIGKP